jgi:hypothetical protein
MRDSCQQTSWSIINDKSNHCFNALRCYTPRVWVWISVTHKMHHCITCITHCINHFSARAFKHSWQTTNNSTTNLVLNHQIIPCTGHVPRSIGRRAHSNNQPSSNSHFIIAGAWANIDNYSSIAVKFANKTNTRLILLCYCITNASKLFNRISIRAFKHSWSNTISRHNSCLESSNHYMYGKRPKINWSAHSNNQSSLYSHFVIAGIGPLHSHRTHQMSLDMQYQEAYAWCSTLLTSKVTFIKSHHDQTISMDTPLMHQSWQQYPPRKLSTFATVSCYTHASDQDHCGSEVPHNSSKDPHNASRSSWACSGPLKLVVTVSFIPYQQSTVIF